MRYLYVMILALLFAGCGGSDFDNMATGQPASGGTAGNQNLPVVLQANGGTFSPEGGEVMVTFTDIESALLVGRDGEGGTVPARDFLSAQNFSRETSRTAELTYTVGSETRLIPLEIIDLLFQDDNTVTITALIPSTGQEADVNAQTATGSISVTVTATDGDLLPGVVIRVTSSALVGSRTFVTDANGRARALGLPPGNYKVTAELTGFKTGVEQNVPVRLGQTTPVNFTLQLATVEELFSSAELVINPPE